MRAAKWKTHDAQKRIKATIEWRRDFKPDLIPPDEVGRIRSMARNMSCFRMFAGQDRVRNRQNVGGYSVDNPVDALLD